MLDCFGGILDEIDVWTKTRSELSCWSDSIKYIFALYFVEIIYSFGNCVFVLESGPLRFTGATPQMGGTTPQRYFIK